MELYMNKNDLGFSLAAAVITAIFLYPTLTTPDLNAKLPVPVILLLIIFVAVSAVSMYAAEVIGRKIPFLWPIAKFGQVGVLNTAIDFGILNFLISITQITSGTGIIFINATSFTTALINSYFWNKGWVFLGSKKSNFITFAVITLIGLSINTGVVYALTTYVPPVIVHSQTLWANVAKLLATGLSLVWNFVGYRLIVFKNAPAQQDAQTA